MKISLKNYTFRYLTISLLAIIGIWAFLFRSFILDEVYDNVDDGLKNQKIEIIRHSYIDSEIVKTNDFGLAQFRILPVAVSDYNEMNRFTNEKVFMPYDGEDEPYRILRTGFYGKNGQPYSLEIRTSTVEEDDLIYDLTISLVVLYLLILISILLINHYGLKKAFLPFELILKQLQTYRFGQAIHLEKVETNVREFNILQNEISTMIERNEKVFSDQKLFIENASHELQTPIAIASNKIDLILENEEIKESTYLQLVETKKSLWQMVNLNKSLLMLSRIENQQYQTKKMVDFVPIVNDLLEDFEMIFELNNINLETQLSASFIVEFNQDLAHILISNLLRNAIKHNNKDKIIKVESNANELIFSNSSDATTLNVDIIYNRFYKLGSQSDSNGLGLSIVQTIINNQNTLKLDYQFRNGLHQFILKKV